MDEQKYEYKDIAQFESEEWWQDSDLDDWLIYNYI
jgi:hypothetical protein